MVRIPTPIPERAKKLWSDFWGTLTRGGVIDTVWKILVIVVFGGLIIALAGVGGPIGLIAGAVFGLVFAQVLSDDIWQLLMDIWERNFWVWRVE